jgi:hypothetical protein
MVAQTKSLFNRYNLIKTGIRVDARLNSILLCHWILCAYSVYYGYPIVFEIKIANKDLLSHVYLSDLVYQQGLRDFILSDVTLFSMTALGGAQTSASVSTSCRDQTNLSKLVVFAE